MCHDTKTEFGLVAKKLEIGSNEFLVGCLYMVVAQNPTRKKSFVGKTMKEEDASSRQSIHNITDIISNDVSVKNLAKQLVVGNGTANPVDKTIGHVLSKKNGTAKNDQASSKPLLNSTSFGNTTATKTMDKALVNKTVVNSTKKATHSNASKPLNDQKTSTDPLVTNFTQNTPMSKTGFQKETNGMAGAQKGKQPLKTEEKKGQDPSAGLSQSTKNNGNKDVGAKQKNPVSGSKAEGSVADDLQNALQGAFMAAKQPAQMGLSTAQNSNLGKLEGPALTKLNHQQKSASGQHPLALNKNGPKQFDLHFEFPTDSPNLSGPAQLSLPGQLAQITAKALGLFQNAALKNGRQGTQQMGQHYTKGAAGLPFLRKAQHQQRPQPQAFRQPLPYRNQQMPLRTKPISNHISPQASPLGPNFINMPVRSGRPLQHQFAVKSPGVQTQFPYTQFPLLYRGYNYQHPIRSEWQGIASVGKQSLEGNRVQYQHNAQGIAQNFPHKTSENLDNDSKDLDKQGERNYKNKVRQRTFQNLKLFANRRHLFFCTLNDYLSDQVITTIILWPSLFLFNIGNHFVLAFQHDFCVRMRINNFCSILHGKRREPRVPSRDYSRLPQTQATIHYIYHNNHC